MTKEEIGLRINRQYPWVYAPTTAPTKIRFKDQSVKVGYFQFTRKSTELEKTNQFTFIEFGEKNDKYRATKDEQFVTIVNGDDLVDVEYPSYFERLSEKLKRLNLTTEDKTEINWEEYKEQWQADVSHLLNTIIYNWLNQYAEANLIEFTLLPVSRSDSYLGSYYTMMLEMQFANSQYIVLEPAAAITSEYNGRLDLYRRGDIYNKFSVFRKLLDNHNSTWMLATSANPQDYTVFSKIELESVINAWIQ